MTLDPKVKVRWLPCWPLDTPQLRRLHARRIAPPEPVPAICEKTSERIRVGDRPDFLRFQETLSEHRFQHSFHCQHSFTPSWSLSADQHERIGGLLRFGNVIENSINSAWGTASISGATTAECEHL
jgi:hypothetical protein